VVYNFKGKGRLRHSNRQTSPSAHSRPLVPSTRSDARCIFLFRVTMPIRPPHSVSPPNVPAAPCSRRAAPIPCGLLWAVSLRCLLRVAFPIRPSLSRPPLLRCLLTVTAFIELACRGRLHRVGVPPRWMLQQVGEGDKIRVTLRPLGSCSCRCCTTSFMRHRRRTSVPPFVQAKPMLQEYISSVSDVSSGCCKSFVLMLQ
jgi:hypothetical protein